ncbi:Probable RNA-directed DNA polymerase from transposon X-element [Eumeta japonica]|uniref:Probable RNA-directed DNA polymerase from transposon X-element n=1 Tax=Eumeta variegata TaxID=151549 RepID=A0A4C1SRG1_EUMVA|nr:Probable RNA-directed DNA polymerase from transposon X-element [Eumeta japonica]
MAIYKSILKPVWTYGIELWGTASNSNIEILERFQTKAIRSMFNIPKCIQNKYILQDLRLKTVKQEIAIRSLSYQLKLAKHVNTLASELSGEVRNHAKNIAMLIGSAGTRLSVYEAVDLDLRLMLKLLALMTTYTVVLLQFAFL